MMYIITGVAHDLNNNFTAMKGSLGLLQMKQKKKQEVCSKCEDLNHIFDSSIDLVESIAI